VYYRVSVEQEDGGRPSFLFTLDEGTIQVLVWDDDFTRYMKYNHSPAAPLFEAVMAFHRAQRMNVTDDE